MKKNSILGGIILLICLAMFNVVAFILPSTRGGAFWSGYIFTTIALLLQMLFTFIAFGKADNIKKTFFGLPVAELGITYLIIQAIWGLACLFITQIPSSFAIVVSTILLAFYSVAIIVAVIGRDYVSEVDTKIKIKTFFTKSMLVDIETLIAKTENTEIKEELVKLADIVKYSDPMSSEALQNVEGRISDKYNTLENAVEINNADEVATICKSLDVLFVERSKKCMLLK